MKTNRRRCGSPVGQCACCRGIKATEGGSVNQNGYIYISFLAQKINSCSTGNNAQPLHRSVRAAAPAPDHADSGARSGSELTPGGRSAYLQRIIGVLHPAVRPGGHDEEECGDQGEEEGHILQQDPHGESPPRTGSELFRTAAEVSPNLRPTRINEADAVAPASTAPGTRGIAPSRPFLRFLETCPPGSLPDPLMPALEGARALPSYTGWAGHFSGSCCQSGPVPSGCITSAQVAPPRSHLVTSAGSSTFGNIPKCDTRDLSVRGRLQKGRHLYLAGGVARARRTLKHNNLPKCLFLSFNASCGDHQPSGASLITGSGQ
ncbi:hypothetical protein NDU88_000217 [Pleurodeles waltl]|uniref:Uncharacterized protein n=1 Tax=Pleurodeles waltl TaxID=8319 RepID=A0AAV7L7P5_PLEWA|nr:hypothetical protein NDU88_000217 [Pleurodeles waltl]